MALEFKRAQREQVKIKISIAGPAGSGKTMSSLLLAYGLVHAAHPDWSDDKVWGSIVLADSENGSGSLYAGTQVGPTRIGEYNVINLAPPFTAQLYMDAIHMAENHNMEVIIVDSLSHVWSGEGGLLDEQGKIAARTNNSYTSWRTISPQYNQLVDTILQSPCHVITDVRAKMDYQQIKGDNGKTKVQAVGMGMILRDGYEYETTVNFMLDADHVANATKDRTGLFDGQYFTIDASTGAKLYAWLSSGAVPAQKPSVPDPVPASQAQPEAPAIDMERVKKAIAAVDPLVKAAAAEDRDGTIARIKEIIGEANYAKCTDINKLTALYKAFSQPQG